MYRHNSWTPQSLAASSVPLFVTKNLKWQIWYFRSESLNQQGRLQAVAVSCTTAKKKGSLPIPLTWIETPDSLTCLRQQSQEQRCPILPAGEYIMLLSEPIVAWRGLFVKFYKVARKTYATLLRFPKALSLLRTLREVRGSDMLFVLTRGTGHWVRCPRRSTSTALSPGTIPRLFHWNSGSAFGGTVE